MNKKLLIILFTVLFYVNINKIIASSINVSGLFSTNTTWNVDTVKITGDIWITQGAKLTIAAGTVVEFQGHFTINIYYSYINAVGNTNDTIQFTYYDTTGIHNPKITNGGWQGIIFNHKNNIESDSTIFDYCSFKYMKNQNFGNTSGSNSIMLMHTQKVKISNCLFTQNFLTSKLANAICYMGSAGVVQAYYSSCKIVNNTFKNNETGYGVIAASGKCSPIISYNTIKYNKASNSGGGIRIYNGSAIITNNIIANNYTIDNYCHGDGGGGIHVSDSSSAYIANNLIANNYTALTGGGIKCSNYSSPMIINNHIVNNFSTLSGGGIYIINSTPSLINNIIWGNANYSASTQNQIHIETDNSDPDITNSCIEGGLNAITLGTGVTYTGNYLNNINSFPNFNSSSAGAGINFDGLSADWRLQTSSPCINSGTLNNLGNLPSTDLWGNPRIQSTTIEIGAYEAAAGSPDGINDYENNSLICVFPNPTTNNFSINYSADFDKAVISIVNAIGQTIETKQFYNSQKLNFDVSSCAKGIYFVNAFIDEKIMSSKIVIK